MRAFALVVLAALAARAEEYPISCWTFMKQEESRAPELVVKDWKDLGITHPMSPVFGLKSDKTTMHRMLDLCDREGLHLIIHDDRAHLSGALRTKVCDDDAAYRADVAAAAADWSRHPSFAGFHLWDEPHASHNAAVFAAAKVVRETVPGKMCFLNLLPWYDWIAPTIGAKAYGPYLDEMSRRTGLPVMCYDCYDQVDEVIGDTRGLDHYFCNLREWSEHVKRNPDRRYWVTLMSFSQAGRVVHTQDAFRWQISTAAAMGAKGISWYYVENPRRKGNNRHLPINPFGERTENFRWLSEENRAFQHQFGSEFMRLAFDEARLVNLDRGGIKAFEPDADVLSVESYKTKEPVLLSFFHDADGARYFALVSLLKERTMHVFVGLADGVRVLSRMWDGEYSPVSTQADPVLAERFGRGSVAKFGIGLAPGQLCLFKIVRK